MNDGISHKKQSGWIPMIYATQAFSAFTKSLFVAWYAVWLFTEKLFSNIESAFIVSICILMSRIFSIFFIKVANKIEKKFFVSGSLILIAIIYFIIYLLAYIDYNDFLVWIIISILLGGSISLTRLGLNSLVALKVKPSQYVQGFSYLYLALNLASGLGPYLGGIILFYNENWLPLVPIIFAILSLFTALFMPRDMYLQTKSQKIKFFDLLKIKPFVLLLIMNFFTFIGFAQFYDIYTLYAHNTLGKQTVGIFFLLSSLVIIGGQIFIARFLKIISQKMSIIISHTLLACSLILLMFANASLLVVCIIGVILFTIAEMFYIPTYLSLAASFATKEHQVSAQASLTFSWGMGEFIATYLGIYLIQINHGEISYIIATISAIIVIALTQIKNNY